MARDLNILHVDMDAFYASVEQRDRPELIGQPVIVGGIEGRGVVSAASYEARKYGVHSAMPMATARRLCPHGIYLPVRMGHYAEISKHIREILFAFTPLVEPLSLDEAFLDVHGCTALFGPAVEIARQIKVRIKAETGLIASVGVAPNKFLAKLASDHSKPDGLVVVPVDGVSDFLAPLPVSRIWGVGAKGEKRLHAVGIHTVGQLAATPKQVLIDHLGEVGSHIWRLANGQDSRAVIPDREAKSISTETTFASDISDPQVLRVCLLDLVDHLATRLRMEGVRGRTIAVKIRSSDFTTRTRSQALPEATHVTEVLWQAASKLLANSLSRDLLPVRLLGVGATRLTREPAVQYDLFETEQRERQNALDQTIDSIRGEFGSSAIRRGSHVNRNDGDKSGGQS